jgi:hypothetical protein
VADTTIYVTTTTWAGGTTATANAALGTMAANQYSTLVTQPSVRPS